jgi:hypothetical protein
VVLQLLKREKRKGGRDRKGEEKRRKRKGRKSHVLARHNKPINTFSIIICFLF